MTRSIHDIPPFEYAKDPATGATLRQHRACREAFDKAGYWPNEVMWKAWQQAWAAALASVPTEELSLSERERVTIDNLIQLAQALNDAMGDGEEMPDGKVLLELPHANLLELGLVVLDDLPDDQPGFTLSGPAKARWALRRLLSPLETQSPEKP